MAKKRKKGYDEDESETEEESSDEGKEFDEDEDLTEEEETEGKTDEYEELFEVQIIGAIGSLGEEFSYRH